MARPSLSLRIIPRFPARIQPGDGIGVTRTGGAVTIRQDWDSITQEAVPADPSTYELLLRDAGGALVRVPGTTLAEATWDNLPDKPTEFPPEPHTHGIPDVINLQSSLDAKVDDTDVIDVAHGGSGRATATAYGILTGGTTATGAHQSVAVGASGHILTSNGAGALPSFQSPAAVSGAVLYNAVQSLTTGETAQARTNVNAPPLPTTSTIVGEWARFFSTSGNSLTLPAGGTWAYFYSGFTGSSTWSTSFQAGVAAGGTQVQTGTVGVIYTGVCWRIA